MLYGPWGKHLCNKKISTKFDHQVDFIQYLIRKSAKPKPLYKLAVIAREPFSVRLSTLIMSLQKKDRSLVVKLFYQNGSNHLAALREYRRLKDLQKGALSRIDLRKMIMKFEETGDLGVLPGRERKPVGVETVEEIAIAVIFIL
ncbi:uncharacterized protein TNCV_2683331 [Trichonephila clavipes]|nr:uncharacterized protein TNCV_2683331 [Trichonephila clavipes]